MFQRPFSMTATPTTLIFGGGIAFQLNFWCQWRGVFITDSASAPNYQSWQCLVHGIQTGSCHGQPSHYLAAY